MAPLGTTTHMSFDIGVITMPLQPAAIARTGSQSNVTDETILMLHLQVLEVKDQNADFSSATFTAPLDGIYLAFILIYIWFSQ